MSYPQEAPVWKITRPMTATMAVTLAEIMDKGGKLIRRQGGYWTVEGEPHLGVIGNPPRYRNRSARR